MIRRIDVSFEIGSVKKGLQVLEKEKNVDSF